MYIGTQWLFAVPAVLLLVINKCNSFLTTSSIGSHCLTQSTFTTSNTKQCQHDKHGRLFDNERKKTVNTAYNRLGGLHMGIPRMFRWLTDQYPSINQQMSVGLSPNRKRIDNFYLDMNGIIHACTHGNEEEFIELDEKVMFDRIFKYTDQLYKIIKPRKVMYLAVDGVAPRAKMNQQRSRRFRSSKEAEALLASLMAREGKIPTGPRFDSNVITPGTEFMYRLGLAFREWIKHKMATDPFWYGQQGGQALGAEQILFSGPDVPGEGEHKIMDYIRQAREDDPEGWGYETDPTTGQRRGGGNLRHCLYGLDADLIMLGLVTHEGDFTLLREKMKKRNQRRNSNNNSSNRNGPQGAQARTDDGQKRAGVDDVKEIDFEVLELSILRRMLSMQFVGISGTGVGATGPAIGAGPTLSEGGNKKWRLERLIDDFVFMCMLVGNDFLPHIPHLDISDGALDLMMETYKGLLPIMGGYLTNKDQIHPQRFELFMQAISRRESLYFFRRGVDEQVPAYKTRLYLVDYYYRKFIQASAIANGMEPPGGDAEYWGVGQQQQQAGAGGGGGGGASNQKRFVSNSNNYRQQQNGPNGGAEDTPPPLPSPHPSKYPLQDIYTLKRSSVEEFLRGMHWVLSYYHKGCQSWTWFYPFLYAPLASDFRNLAYCNTTFERGRPFPPLVQLLSVLPPQSADMLPKPYMELMVHEGGGGGGGSDGGVVERSPLIHYYPGDFQVDKNGKHNDWENVVLIPFIDEAELVEVLSRIDHTKELAIAERRRNILGREHAYPNPSLRSLQHRQEQEQEQKGGGEVVDVNGASDSAFAAAAAAEEAKKQKGSGAKRATRARKPKAKATAVNGAGAGAGAGDGADGEAKAAAKPTANRMRAKKEVAVAVAAAAADGGKKLKPAATKAVKKSEVSTDGGSATSSEETPATAAATATATATRRKRGRPKKSSAAPASSDSD